MQKFCVLFFTLTTFYFFSAPVGSAQTNKTAHDSLPDNESDSNRSLLLEVDYGSNRGYQQKRKTAGSDTTQTPQQYVIGSLNYAANSGFFCSFDLYKTPGAKKKWDQFLVGLGWDFKISKSADIDGSIGYTHYTYNEAIKNNEATPSTGDLSAYISHDFGIVNIRMTGDYYFGGTNNDVDLITDVDRAFYIDEVFSKKDELSFDPMFTITASTLNYYKEGVNIPDTITGGPKKKQVLAALQSVYDDFGKFRFINYEFSLPVNYQIGKFNFEVGWHYTMFFNLLPSDLPPALSEKLAPVLNRKSYSYITAMISFDFLR